MSEIIIPAGHILYTSANEVEAICAPLFEPLDLAYFSFLRIYANGERVHLSMNPDVQKRFYENFYHYVENGNFTNQMKYYKSGYLKWKDLDTHLVYHVFLGYRAIVYKLHEKRIKRIIKRDEFKYEVQHME